jgi:hypothetical protein
MSVDFFIGIMIGAISIVVIAYFVDLLTPSTNSRGIPRMKNPPPPPCPRNYKK